MDVGFWIFNVLFLAPWLYALFRCIEIHRDDDFQETQGGDDMSNEYYVCSKCGKVFFERPYRCPHCGSGEVITYTVHAAGAGGSSPTSYVPQAWDGGAGASHQYGNGCAGLLWTFYGTGQSCRCSEHCLEFSCDHGRMRFIKCYVCGSDWLIPAVKSNPLKDIKIKPIPTKVVRW